eukprot:GHVU01113367.1.p1 GENE.GHVU01113367.1~~GHVU01113367.1.p1  ORF type:complete len:127 (-),score=16.77 GHVU01113367.1:727-1107(-)
MGGKPAKVPGIAVPNGRAGNSASSVKSHGMTNSQSQISTSRSVAGEGMFSRANFIAQHGGNLKDFYELEDRSLGKGTYGFVVPGVHKATRKVRAVKVIGKKKVKNVERFRKEIEIMKSIVREYIII